ncbi:MAG TPA: hypothetical protein VM223_11690 [Planctomycetota bacterium]|nr:hypothetical protein [Planctomycetota bacterium]
MNGSNKALKIATPIVIGIAAVATLLIALRRPERREERIYLQQGAIIIEKPGTRLADVAGAIADPAIFSYDPATRHAQTSAHLHVAGAGTLTIGSDEHGELLEFNTNVCGDASIIVDPAAAFEAINSEIATVHRTVSAGICTRGYTIFCDGRLTARNTKFLYFSGNRSTFYRGDTATGELDNVVIALSDGASLRMADVDGERLSLHNCRFETAGKYGLYLLGNTRNPVRVESTSLIGAAADVFLSMGRADLELVDCSFSRDRVRFENAKGSVRVKWRAHVRVTDDAGKPVAGAAVLAECKDEKVTATSDAEGLAVLEVTEYIITANGVRAVTPHSFQVLGDNKVSGESISVSVNGTAGTMGEIKLTKMR